MHTSHLLAMLPSLFFNLYLTAAVPTEPGTHLPTAVNHTLKGPSSRPRCVELADWATTNFRESDCTFVQAQIQSQFAPDLDVQSEFVAPNTRAYTGLPVSPTPFRWVYSRSSPYFSSAGLLYACRGADMQWWTGTCTIAIIMTKTLEMFYMPKFPGELELRESDTASLRSIGWSISATMKGCIDLVSHPTHPTLTSRAPNNGSNFVIQTGYAITGSLTHYPWRLSGGVVLICWAKGRKNGIVIAIFATGSEFDRQLPPSPIPPRLQSLPGQIVSTS